MEAPPPYMPPKKKSNLIIWLVLGGVLLCCILPCGLLGGLGYWGMNQFKGFAGCIIGFEDVQRALQMYADEHGGKLPNAATWQDDIREEFRHSMRGKKAGQIEEMTPEGDWGCKDPKGVLATGIAFNEALSGKKLSDIKDPTTTVLVFETDRPGKNLHEVYKIRDYLSSPTMVGNVRRGWLIAPVSGKLALDQNGKWTDVNTRGGSGFNVEVNSGSDSGK